MALEPIEARAPLISKNNNFQLEISQAISGVLSNLVAPRHDATAVITKTNTIRGFETSIYDPISTAFARMKVMIMWDLIYSMNFHVFKRIFYY